MRRTAWGALVALVLFTAMPAAAAKVTIQASTGSNRDSTVVVRAGHDSVVISGPLANIPPEAWAKLSPKQIQDLAEAALVFNRHEGARPSWWGQGLGAGKNLVALGAVLGVPLAFFLFVLGIVFLVVRNKRRAAMELHQQRLALIEKGVTDPMLLGALKREPKAPRVFRLMIWGSVFLFGGAGYIIWKALDEGIRHAGFGFVLMLIGVGLGLAARQMERRLPANGEKATPPTDAGSAQGGETTA